MMLIWILIKSIHICPTRYLYLYSYIPFGHNIIDAKSAFQHLLHDLCFLFLIFFLFVSGLGLDLVLIDAICNIGSHACTGARINAISIMIEASPRPRHCLNLFQHLTLFELLDIQVTEIRRSKVRIASNRPLPHPQSFIEVHLLLNSFNDLAGMLSHYHRRLLIVKMLLEDCMRFSEEHVWVYIIFLASICYQFESNRNWNYFRLQGPIEMINSGEIHVICLNIIWNWAIIVLFNYAYKTMHYA